MGVFVALFLLLFITLSSLAAYALICDYKTQKLLTLFKIIADQPSTRQDRENAADQAIKIMHGHKTLPPPSIILININEGSENLFLAYNLLKAEIRYLIKAVDGLRSQKKYLNSIPPENRMRVLKFISETDKFLNKIDFAPIGIFDKVILVSTSYRAAAKRYSTLPAENNHEELNFAPLFIIADKTPTGILVLMPYFPYPQLPA